MSHPPSSILYADITIARSMPFGSPRAAPASFRIDPSGLASPGNKDRVLIQFTFQNFREQSRLHFQQPPIRER